jgi:choline kinase
MKGLILAAGQGSRMGELTRDKPKCLVCFNGRTLLDRQLAALKGAGLSEIGAVGGYRANQLRGLVDMPFKNARWRTTGIVESLCSASRWLSEDEVIVSYGDIFYGVDTVKALVTCDEDIAITFDPDWLDLWARRFEHPLSDAEYFECKDDEVTKIGGKIDGEVPTGQYMGLIKLRPRGFKSLKRSIKDLDPDFARTIDMTSLLGILVGSGARVKAVPRVEPWGEVDHPSDLLLYEKLYPRL